MERLVVIYHKGCPDGYGALSGVVYKYGVKNLFYDEENDILYNYDSSFVAIPSNHSTDFTRLKELLEKYPNDNFTLHMVDFFVDKIFEVVKNYPNIKRVVVIDHHKTAKEIIDKVSPKRLKINLKCTSIWTTRRPF